jgi:hypothetical protein
MCPRNTLALAIGQLNTNQYYVYLPRDTNQPPDQDASEGLMTNTHRVMGYAIKCRIACAREQEK